MNNKSVRSKPSRHLESCIVSEIYLWNLTSGSRVMRCTVAEILDPMRDAWDKRLLGVELRVERNGELYLTELHRKRETLYARCQELRDVLVTKGWT